MDKKTSKKSTKKLVGLITMLVGILVCIAGLVFFLINIFAEPGLRDAEYLVKVGTWVREDEPAVIWNFTEIGKGVLTTNSHTNDYNFIWAISGETLEVETSWLYTLDDNYTYKLSQSDKTLILTKDEETIKFVPAEKPVENTENNEASDPGESE